MVGLKEYKCKVVEDKLNFLDKKNQIKAQIPILETRILHSNDYISQDNVLYAIYDDKLIEIAKFDHPILHLANAGDYFFIGDKKKNIIRLHLPRSFKRDLELQKGDIHELRKNYKFETKIIFTNQFQISNLFVEHAAIKSISQYMVFFGDGYKIVVIDAYGEIIQIFVRRHETFSIFDRKMCIIERGLVYFYHLLDIFNNEINDLQYSVRGSEGMSKYPEINEQTILSNLKQKINEKPEEVVRLVLIRCFKEIDTVVYAVEYRRISNSLDFHTDKIVIVLSEKYKYIFNYHGGDFMEKVNFDENIDFKYKQIN